MRSRAPLLALLFVVVSFALPLAAHAQAIPFLGPIIPERFASCPAGWGLLITVINNIIRLLLTLAIVFVAPLMIAWSGFLFVVNPVNESGISKAKGILTHTVFGIVIALAGWMIVAAIMAALYNAPSGWGTWSNLITGSGDACLRQEGAPYTPGPAPPSVAVPAACPAQLTPLDSAAQGMESSPVVWTNTNPKLQTCVNKFIGSAGGSVTSAYRPQAYQTHLWEIVDRWCTKNLKSNTNSACSALKSTVSEEVTRHALSACYPVAQTTSTHGAGTGVDISGVTNRSTAGAACLRWYGSGDPVHYTLDLTIPGCSCP
ncbi:MAG: pilin [Patescibacteria group bacterium]